MKKWDDLRFPASAVNPAGQASDPDIDTTNGGFLFAAIGTEVLFFQAQMPHTYAEYTAITPHVHWMKTSSASGDVVWEFAYKVAKIGEVMDSSFTTVTASSPVDGTPDNDTANEHLISSFGELSIDDFTISDMLLIKVSRLGGDAGDTYNADCRLIEFDIHYQVDGHGSAGEFYKVWRKGSHS